MSDEVYEAIACATSGFVESPAGCGKTEAIVRTVGTYCSDPQLILTCCRKLVFATEMQCTR